MQYRKNTKTGFFFGVILSFIFPGNLPKANNFIEITYDMAELSHLKIFVHPGN